jgi:DNA (cytosine-5)-methyltransferase 1
MLKPQFILPLADELVVDLFAGGGGASTGIEQAIGRHVDIAINHDPDAIGMHEVNHPQTQHFCEDVYDVDPIAATAGRSVGLIHASPDCTHHSQALGGQPRDQEIRSLAWVIPKWVGKLRKTGQGPKVCTLENVEQMLHWSPLIAKRDAATGRVVTLDRVVDPSTGAKTYRVAAKGEQVPRRNQFLVPDPRRKGRNWQHFVDHLRRLGGNMQWRVIKNADLGAHSTRERLYAVIRFDGEPIVWPELTHSKNGTGGKQKWRPAADCIDWSINGRSIFGREKPLAEATMRRIAHGMRKYVLESPDPFIVPATHTDTSDRTRSSRDPFPTVTAANRGELMLSAPTLVPITHMRDTAFDPLDPFRTITTANGGETALATAILVGAGGPEYAGKPKPVGGPLGTVLPDDHRALVAAHLVQVSYGERKGQEPRALDAQQPIDTMVAGGIKHAVATAYMVQAGHGEGAGKTKRRSHGAKSARDPIGAVTASGSGGQAVGTAFMVQANGGFNTTHARDMLDPASTLTTSGSQQQLITAHLTTLRKHSVGREARDPMATVSAGGEHQALVEYHLSEEDEAGALRCAAFLMRYHGTGGQWSDLRDPTTTVTTHDRLALVTVWLHGKPFVIVDICLRMLVPRELYNAQDFPPLYVIDRTSTGKALTKTAQVRMCGNSVSPLPMSLIVGANFSERGALRKVA